jgi:hypothetical protein
MMQIKIFNDSPQHLAEKLANDFLHTIKEKQIVDIKFTVMREEKYGNDSFTSIMILYKS